MMKTLMNCHQIVSSFAVLSLGCFLSSMVAAQSFVSSYPDGGTWNTVYAQGFSPSVDSDPEPGLSASDPVFLTQFDFFKSGNSDAASNIQLAIVDQLFHDYASNPLTTSSSALVGLSSNTLADTSSIATGDPVSFSFSSLPLTYGEDYAAVFVNVDGSGNVSPVLVSALTANYVDDGTGTFVPETNYGTDSEFQYATSNFIDNGFFNTFSFAGDARFTATFSQIPEPQSAVLLLTGLVTVFRAVSRRTI